MSKNSQFKNLNSLKPANVFYQGGNIPIFLLISMMATLSLFSFSITLPKKNPPKPNILSYQPTPTEIPKLLPLLTPIENSDQGTPTPSPTIEEENISDSEVVENLQDINLEESLEVSITPTPTVLPTDSPTPIQSGPTPTLTNISQNNFNPSAFVKTSGRDLNLDGHIFKFIGVNRYNIMTHQINGEYLGCGGYFSDEQLIKWFDELEVMGVNSVRFWAFQQFTLSGEDFSRFDFLLELASKNNIKIIPVLENQWTDCTKGGYKSGEWYEGEFKSPYGGYPISFKDYVGKVVTRYKDKPEILMWQIMNEAESRNSDGRENPQALYNFTKEISEYIKSIDKNHLVSLGTIGNGQPGIIGDEYKTLHSLESIDLLDYHDYGYENMSISPTLKNRIDDSKALNKPLFIGEAGIKINCSEADCYTTQKRVEIFTSKIAEFYKNNGAGYLIWSYRDTDDAPVQNFDFINTDPLSSLIKFHSESINSSSIPPSPPPADLPDDKPTPIESGPTLTPTPTVITNNSLSFYSNNLNVGISNWSWDANVNFLGVDPTSFANKVISFAPYKGWGALRLHFDKSVNTASFKTLNFSVFSTTDNPKYTVSFWGIDGKALKRVTLESLGKIQKNTWKSFSIPLLSLNAQDTQVQDFIIQEWSGNPQLPLYIDDLGLK